MQTVGFTLENTSKERCTQIHQCDLQRIEDKLDLILDKLNGMNGIKDFGISVLANVFGNRIDGNKR